MLLLADDVALEVHAHFDGLAALGGCAAPDASAVLLEPGNIGEAACLNPGFGLTLSETVGPGDRSARIGRAVRRVHRRRVGIAVSRRALLSHRWNSGGYQSRRNEKFARKCSFFDGITGTTTRRGNIRSILSSFSQLIIGN